MINNIYRVVVKNSVINVFNLIDLDDIEIAHKIDYTIFRSHQTLSFSTYKNITDYGAIFAVKYFDQMIGISAILLTPVKDYPTFTTETALCFGTAILPEFRRKGYGTALAKTQEIVAKQNGKHKLLLSVRPENAASIFMRLKLGFKIVCYDPFYFGDENIKNGRLILSKIFADIESKVERDLNSQKSVTVTFKIGEETDFSAREKLLSLQSDGFSIFNCVIHENRKELIYYLKSHN